MLRIFLIFTMLSCICAESITAKDILFLVDLGVEETEIIRHIKEADNRNAFSPQDIELLKKKGISSRIIEVLSSNEDLSAASIVQKLKEGQSRAAIITEIKQAKQIENYDVKDWLLLRRNGVPQEVVSALKNKFSPKSDQISIKDVRKLFAAGKSSDEIIAVLKKSEINRDSINSNELLKLKNDGYPLELIKFLAEVHLNPDRKDISEIKKEPQPSLVEVKEPKKDKPQTKIIEPKNRLVSPKEADVYVQLYPGASHVALPKLEENVLAKVKREFYCSLFAVDSPLENIEDFYRKAYPKVQVSRINFNELVHILKLKFAVSGSSEMMEIHCYSIDTQNLDRIKNIEQIRATITKNDSAVNKISVAIQEQKDLYAAKKISLEEHNAQLSLLQSKLNIMLNTTTYWDHVVIKHVLEKKRNMLLIVQPVGVAITTNPRSGLVDQISKVSLEPAKRKTLAKDYPLVVFPQTKLISHDKMEEGLKRTSKSRSLYRSLFLCNASTDTVEAYYRKYFKGASVWRIHYLNSFVIVKAKFEVPEIRSQVEVAFYALDISPKSKRWGSRQKRIKERLQELERSVKNIDNEISALRELMAQNKISIDNAELRIRSLEGKKQLKMNASSYWDFIVMDKVMTSQNNILLVKEVKHHF